MSENEILECKCGAKGAFQDYTGRCRYCGASEKGGGVSY